MPRLPLDIAQALDRIQRGGFAFDTARTPCPHYPEPQSRPVKYRAPEDWTPWTPPPKPPKPPKPSKTPKPSKPPQPIRTVVVDPAQVGCTAPDALGQAPLSSFQNAYVRAHELAEARLRAGWRQGRCLTCLRWRWADEPCGAARFDQPPVRGQDPQETP